MTRSWQEYVIVAGAVLVMALLAWSLLGEASRCEGDGGTFAKTYDGLPQYECVDPR